MFHASCIKHAVFMYFLHLVLTSPHDIIAEKGFRVNLPSQSN